jgi:hypothetical protein
MPNRPTRPRALQIALVVEIVWALFLAYWVHRQYSATRGLSGVTVGWQYLTVTYVQTLAPTAIAIVVVTWLVDQVVSSSDLKATWDRCRTIGQNEPPG